MDIEINQVKQTKQATKWEVVAINGHREDVAHIVKNGTTQLFTVVGTQGDVVRAHKFSEAVGAAMRMM